MLPPDVDWIEDAKGARMVHRELVVARAESTESGVLVTTRCYIEGWQRSRRLATMAGARRYLEAWWLRWEQDVRLEVLNKVTRWNAPPQPDGREYPHIQVRPRKPRRRT